LNEEQIRKFCVSFLSKGTFFFFFFDLFFQKNF